MIKKNIFIDDDGTIILTDKVDKSKPTSMSNPSASGSNSSLDTSQYKRRTNNLLNIVSWLMTIIIAGVFSFISFFFIPASFFNSDILAFFNIYFVKDWAPWIVLASGFVWPLIYQLDRKNIVFGFYDYVYTALFSICSIVLAIFVIKILPIALIILALIIILGLFGGG